MLRACVEWELLTSNSFWKLIEKDNEIKELFEPQENKENNKKIEPIKYYQPLH